MEYCDAGSLETLYRRAGSIPEDVLGLITKDVLTALSELRLNHKVLHRGAFFPKSVIAESFLPFSCPGLFACLGADVS
jgi:serine/threonine protein kinase